jgi:hypothetical protein
MRFRMVVRSSLPTIGISAFWTAEAIFIPVFDGDLPHSCVSDTELSRRPQRSHGITTTSSTKDVQCRTNPTAGKIRNTAQGQ